MQAAPTMAVGSALALVEDTAKHLLVLTPFFGMFWVVTRRLLRAEARELLSTVLRSQEFREAVLAVSEHPEGAERMAALSRARLAHEITQLGALDRRVATMEREVETTNSLLRKIEERTRGLDGLPSAIEDMSGKFEALDGSLREARERLAALYGRGLRDPSV